MGNVEYDTIAEIKQAVSIPIIANGDIDSPAKAKAVLNHTGVDGIMIGRAAQGRPWLFNEIEHYLKTGTVLPPPPLGVQARIIESHLNKLYAFYGDYKGVLFARKHVAEYVADLPEAKSFRAQFNQFEDPQNQLEALQEYFAILEGTIGALAA